MFGETLRTVHGEGNVSSEVTFNFTSAIRYNKSLLVKGKVLNESMYGCPDEGWACPGTESRKKMVNNCGCPYTAWVQCALKQTSTRKQQADFIMCWDGQDLSGQVQMNKSLEAAASTCSTKLGLDWARVRACNFDYSGERAELLFAAANRFMEKWPEFTPMDGIFSVPHVLIGKNSKDMEEIEIDRNSSDLERINAKFCSLGVQTGTCGDIVV